MASTLHFSVAASSSAMGPIRRSKTAWARDFHTQQGEIIRVFGHRHMPSPANWWPAEKSSSAATKTRLSRRRARRSKGTTSSSSPPASPTHSLKRKTTTEITESANECEQPPSKRSCTRIAPLSAALPTPLPTPLPTCKPKRTTRSPNKVRTRSQVDTGLLKKQVPLQSNTIPTPPVYIVPRELRGLVPQFNKAGGHCCGEHKRPFRAPKWVDCRDCNQSLPYSSMHVLSCGHALCRACLNDNAAQTKAVLNSRRAWNQVQDCRDKHENLLALKGVGGLDGHEGDGDDSPDTLAYNVPSPSLYAKPQPLESSQYFDKALQLLNLWCCGMDTGISEYRNCMDPDNSAANWLVDQLLQDPECFQLAELEQDVEGESFNRCGWPDCQSLLTSACRFKQGCNPDSAFTYYYCVQCSGVSLAKGQWDNVPSWSM